MTRAAAQSAAPFTPEQRAAWLAWRWGSTTDWRNLILMEVGYPLDLYWFCDAVQGLCKGKPLRIAHSTLAKRAQRFKNKGQAKALTVRAIEADREWARERRTIIFDIERPRPHAVKGKDKRETTLYTDYLTAPAVWAQETMERVKKSDPVRWKKDKQYRTQQRREILNGALEMLPQFQAVEDMPGGGQPKESQPLPLSDYVEQRRTILVAEGKRIADKLVHGQLLTIEEIDERLALLHVSYQNSVKALMADYQRARKMLEGLRATCAKRAANLFDELEVVRPVDELLWRKSYDDEPAPDGPVGWLRDTMAGQTGDRVPPREREEVVNECTRGYAHVPPSTPPADLPDPADAEYWAEDARAWEAARAEHFAEGNKGYAGVPPSSETSAGNPSANVMLEEALAWAGVGVAIFPVYEAVEGRCACPDGDACRSPAKHPYFHPDDLPDGKKSATTDPELITRWWTRWPGANIAARMGGPANLLAVDIDPRSGGSASLNDLTEAHGDEWLQTRCHKTGGGGWHFFYSLPEGLEVHRAKLAPGIDLKHGNGYVLMPPSNHVKGWYTVENPAPVLPAPAWLVAELTRPRTQEPSRVINFQDERDRRGQFGAGGQFFGKGERNDGLRNVACGRWVNGWAVDAADLYQQVRAVRDSRCAVVPGDPPPTDAQLWDLVRRTTQKFARGELRRSVPVA